MVKKLKNLIRPFYYSFKNFFNWQVHILKHKNKSIPVYSEIKTQGIKLHIGAGEINLQGWINLDARKYDHTHLVSENIQLNEFTDGKIEEIYLCHVLEHFSFEEADKLLEIFFKKLKKEGILRLAVPCFDSILKVYEENQNDIEKIKYALMGGQDYQYNFHKSVYNFNHLKALLIKHQFKNIVKWNTKEDFGQEIGDWSSAKFKTKAGIVSISLNVKAVKK